MFAFGTLSSISSADSVMYKNKLRQLSIVMEHNYVILFFLMKSCQSDYENNVWQTVKWLARPYRQTSLVNSDWMCEGKKGY